MLRASSLDVWNGFRHDRLWLVTAAFVLIQLMDTVPGLYANSYLEAGERVFLTDIISMSLQTAGGGSFLFWLRFCLYAVPYACCFFDEHSQKAVKYRIVRSSAYLYAFQKMAACIVLTALSVWISEQLYAIILYIQGVPLVLPQAGEHNTLYYCYGLVADGKYLEFWFLLSLFKCFSGIFFSSMTLMLSAFIRNKYMLIAMPLALFFSLDSFSGIWFDNGLTQPDLLNWRIIFFSLFAGGVKTELSALLRTTVYTFLGVGIFGMIFAEKVRRVMEDE